MANYDNIKATINANIKTNGNQEITGSVLNSVLNQIVNTLGAGYLFAGVATTATDPGFPDAKVFYIANGKGTYTNFGGIEVTEDEVVVLYWDTAWHKEATGIASQSNLTELESEVGVYKLHGVVDSSFSGIKFYAYKFKKGEQYEVVVNSGTITQIGFYTGSYTGSRVKQINIVIQASGHAYIFVPADCDYFGVYVAGGVDFILIQIGNKAIVNQQIQSVIDESFNGLLNLRGLIDDGGYYNNDGSVVTDENWRCGIISLLDYEGKRIRVRFGYSKYYTAHCFIKRLDEFIELGSMEDYSINSDFASFICPSDAELYFACEKKLTDRWAKVETSLYEVQNEVLKKEDSKIVYTQNVGTTIRIPIDSLCELNGRGYFRIVNKSNSTIYYAIRIQYGVSGKTYLTNAWLLPYESKVLSFDRVNPNATYIDVYPLISGIVYDYEVVIEKENPTIHNELVTIPRLGEGELMVSRSEEIYCHSPRILQTDRYISIVYQSAMTRTTEGGSKEAGGDFRITMLNMDLVGGVRNYINVMDDAHGYDFLNGYPVEHSYNHAIAYKLEKSGSPWARNLYIRFCAICNGKSVMCYKVYNLTTGKMSDVNMQKLSYGGSAVDWTWNNYIKMVNSMYGHSYDETLMERYTLEHSGIYVYNGNFYCVVAHQCTGDDEMQTTNVPFVFMRSTDCVTWTPIKELWSDMPASECELAINNDICLFACRTTNRGTYYATFDISGNILRSVEQLSSVASKPFPFEYKGNFYCLANIPNENDTTYGRRTEMGIYKLSAENTLIKEKEYKFNSGCQYFTAANVGEDVFIVNNGDIRGLNANATENFGPSNNISIMKL